MSFEILIAKTGDRAEADTFEGALLVADTLCRDHADQLGLQGALDGARRSVTISEDGCWAGIATWLAQEGHLR